MKSEPHFLRPGTKSSHLRRHKVFAVLDKLFIPGQEQINILLVGFEAHGLVPGCILFWIRVHQECDRVAAHSVNDGLKTIYKYRLIIVFRRDVEGIRDSVDEGSQASLHSSRSSSTGFFNLDKEMINRNYNSEHVTFHNISHSNSVSGRLLLK